MPKVYVINRGGHDYSAAEQFGSLVYCSEGVVHKYNTSQMLRLFQGAMKDSTQDDYILLTSLATMCSIACAYFAAKHGRINLLIFRDGQYVERTVLLK